MVPRLATKRSNLWEQAIICNGNLWFQGWEPGVPISGNRQFLATVTSGNRQFLATVTHGSEVGNGEFQSLATGSYLQWQPMVPRLGTRSSNLWERGGPCNRSLLVPRLATMQEFQSLGTGSSLNCNLRFRGWERGVPISGNRQFLAMVSLCY